MKRLLAVAAGLALAALGCGDAAAEPTEIVDEMFQSTADGDNATWRESYAADAVVVFPDGSSIPMFGAFAPIRDDFNGDGVLSWADDTRFRNAMHGPVRQEMSWECATVGEGVVECSVTATDVWIDAAGAYPLLTTARFSVDDGAIVREEFLRSPDPAGMEETLMAHFEMVTTYERWVRDTHPDQYTTLFHEPCCQANLVGLPAAIALHARLVDEFFASIGWQPKPRGRSAERTTSLAQRCVDPGHHQRSHLGTKASLRRFLVDTHATALVLFEDVVLDPGALVGIEAAVVDGGGHGHRSHTRPVRAGRDRPHPGVPRDDPGRL